MDAESAGQPIGSLAFDPADRLAILNLLHSYGYFIDEGMTDAFAGLFTDAPEVAVWAGQHRMIDGWDAWRETVLRRQREFAAAGVQRRHVISAVRFNRQDRDRAEGNAYALLYSATGGRTELVTSGMYEFAAVAQDGEWKIARWIAHVDGAMDKPEQHS